MNLENENFYTRTETLIGKDNLEKLKKCHVAIFGIGGVGGTAAEALVRSGIGEITLIDHDVVKPSNLNRQLLYSHVDLYKAKVEAAKSRLKSINPNLVIRTYQIFFDEKSVEKISLDGLDYVIDALDSMKSKVLLIKLLLTKNLGFISSLGMGNRLDPSKLSILSLEKTHDDPLAKKLRHELKQEGIDLKKIKVVASTESPVRSGAVVSSMMLVPSAAGLLLAYHVINQCILKKER